MEMAEYLSFNVSDKNFDILGMCSLSSCWSVFMSDSMKNGLYEFIIRDTLNSSLNHTLPYFHLMAPEFDAGSRAASSNWFVNTQAEDSPPAKVLRVRPGRPAAL